MIKKYLQTVNQLHVDNFQENTLRNRPHAIPRDVKDCIKQHISMFPVVDSHYTRQNTQKKYLESEISIAKMYCFYQEWVK